MGWSTATASFLVVTAIPRECFHPQAAWATPSGHSLWTRCGWEPVEEVVRSSRHGRRTGSDRPAPGRRGDHRPGRHLRLRAGVRQGPSHLDRHLTAAHAALEPGGLFWISYPKGSSKVPTDLNRDVFLRALQHLGVRPFTQVSVDEVWSALWFRPFAEVGSR
jgi:hypothetical protein